MTIVLAFASALCFGVALVLTQLGLRHLSPLAGAAIAIPSSTLLLICVAPVALAGSAHRRRHRALARRLALTKIVGWVERPCARPNTSVPIEGMLGLA
jgi:uncharacterized membrane protein